MKVTKHGMEFEISMAMTAPDDSTVYQCDATDHWSWSIGHMLTANDWERHPKVSLELCANFKVRGLDNVATGWILIECLPKVGS